MRASGRSGVLLGLFAVTALASSVVAHDALGDPLPTVTPLPYAHAALIGADDVDFTEPGRAVGALAAGVRTDVRADSGGAAPAHAGLRRRAGEFLRGGEC